LGEADVGEVAEGDRQLLFVGEVDADGRHLGGCPDLEAAASYVFCSHISTPARCDPQSRSFLAAILTRARLRWSYLDSRSLRSSLVPRCDPHSRSSSVVMTAPVSTGSSREEGLWRSCRPMNAAVRREFRGARAAALWKRPAPAGVRRAWRGRARKPV